MSDIYEESKQKRTKEEIISNLQKALSKEKLEGQNKLQHLEPDFYTATMETLKQYDEYDRELLDPLLIELVRIRNGKIIKIVDAEKHDYELTGLTSQEYTYFKKMQQAKKKYRDEIYGGMK